MKRITLITGNWAKVAIAKQYLEPAGYKVNNVKMDFVEIEGNTIKEVAFFIAKYASKELKCNVVITDIAITIDALNGFPGPYSHYVLHTIGEKGILKLLRGVDNRSAKLIQLLVYSKHGKEPVLFTSIIEGTISKRVRGKYKNSWDCIFIPEGEDNPIATFNNKDSYYIMNDKVYEQLVDYLKKNKGV